MTKQVRTFQFKGAESGHEFTGERYLPGVAGPIQYEHYHRYLFSAPLCEGKEVLDIASGEGYGSALLAQSAKSVIGVDIDAQAVENARARYGDRANLRYEHGSATAIPLPDASVDVLNSFETLEHFREHEAFMTEARRVLRPNGLMIISTPNRPIYSPPGSVPHEYHVRELDRDEFVQWLGSGFKNFVLYEQKPTAGSLLFREGRQGAREVNYWAETAIGEYRSTPRLVDPVYFIAIASDGPLPEPADDVLEGALSFAQYDNNRNAEAVRLNTEIIKRDEVIGNLTVETVRLNQEIIARNHEIVSRNQEIVARNHEIVANNQKIIIWNRENSHLNAHREIIARSHDLLARDHENSHLNLLVESLQAQVDAIYQSASWRVTKPLRFVARSLRSIVRRAQLSSATGQATKSAVDDMALTANERMPAIPDSPGRFEQPAHARATLVVIQMGDGAGLDKCLAALKAHTTTVPYRVWVVGPQSVKIESKFGIQMIREHDAARSLASLRDNLGSIDSDFLVLLTDQLIAHPKWIEAIDEAFTRFSDAAAVSALVLDKSGKVEAAGSTIATDARLRPNHAGLSPRSPSINAVMRVACAAPGFLAIRKSAWERIAGNFGSEAPLGTGLAGVGLLLAGLGENTYLQPFARFTHLTVAHHGSESEDGKWDNAHQRWALRQRFERTFAAVGASSDVVTLAQRPKIVMVDAFVPKPDQDSGSADVFWYLRIFHALGYEVSFVAAFEETPAEHYADALRRWGVRVQYAQGLSSLNRLVLEEATGAQAVLVQRITVARHVIAQLRVALPNVKVVFGTVDLHYLRDERAAIHARSAQALDDAASLRREELRAVGLSDATIVLSRLEHDILKAILPEANVHRIPIPRVPARSTIGFEGRSGVVFVGGFAHRPNIDAVMYLVQEIWPLVRKALPRAVLRIVGSNVTREVQALDNAEAGVEIVGFVKDLDSALGNARLSVAPLRFGAGIKGKVVSSLLHGLPCVLTKVASEGMGLRDGEEVLEGETAEEIAAAIVRLHEDPQLWKRIADAGFAAAIDEYSVESVAARLSSLLGSIGLVSVSGELAAGAFNVQ
jgi:SAM-dependent methyltransferase/glycosyltransferase involved in cell wall biosynthesis